MTAHRDRELGMNRRITRRDFLNGVAIGLGAGIGDGFLPSLIWADTANESAPQDKPGYYPPALTGLRGSHVGLRRSPIGPGG